MKRKSEELAKAIVSCDIQQIKEILLLPEAKVIVNETDVDFYNSLFQATKISNEETTLTIMMLLLEADANPYHKEENKENIIFYLARDGKAKIIEKLLNTYKYDLNEPDKYNQTPLFWAAKLGRLKAAQILVKFGIHINHLDDNGQSCLFYAAKEGHLEMCKFLINRGCQHDLVDKVKKTPLNFAKSSKQSAIVEYLLSLKDTVIKKKQKSVKEIREEYIEPPKPKKKEIQRSQYVLVYTNDDGNVHGLSPQQLQAFKILTPLQGKIYNYMFNPDLLENVDTKHDKKFIKIANRIINQYLKKIELQIFHIPVDVNIYLDYLIHVHRPMDFGTIKTKLNYNCYENEEQFKSDVLLVYDNCIRYNGSESDLGRMAGQLKLEFIETYKRESLII